MKENIRINVKLISTLDKVLFMSASDIIAKTGINKSTWYKIMKKPEGITVQQLLSIANGLHIPVRRFFFLGNTFLVGNREDYITEPYLACDYDGEKLRDIVNDRRQREATWRRAAAAVNMSPLRLRNSIIGETRLPMNRFLDVCRAFSVDPFTVLIDPNPQKSEVPSNDMDLSKMGSTTLPEDFITMRLEISKLRAQLFNISYELDSLRRKITII